ATLRNTESCQIGTTRLRSCSACQNRPADPGEMLVWSLPRPIDMPRRRRKTMIARGISLAVSMLALLAFTSSGGAQANSRLTIENRMSDKILINVCNGGDTLCIASMKGKFVEPGESKGMGCEGDGKHRCKIMVSDHVTKEMLCTGKYHSCGDTAINIPNNATLVVKGPTDCVLEEAQ